MHVTEYIVKAIHAQGINHFFIGLGGLNDLFMPPLTATKGIRTIVAAFEGGAAFMADGYARASGNFGVCFAIGGPGLLNMTTALAAANTDRSAVLAISGEIAHNVEGLGWFQDGSETGINDANTLHSISGLSWSIPSAAVVPNHLRQAITYACSRRSTAHLSVPVDVQKAMLEDEWPTLSPNLLSPRIIDEQALSSAIEQLNDPTVRNIIILAGKGAKEHGAATALLQFAERFDIPVATTLSGRDVIPENHPLALGVFGYGGTRWAIDAICSDQVDILLVIGSHLAQRDTMQWDPRMLPNKALIHIDADPLLIGRAWAKIQAVIANPATALAKLADMPTTSPLTTTRANRRALLAAIHAKGSRQYDVENTESNALPIHPARVVAELRAAFPNEGVLCVDSGAHRAWFAAYWQTYYPGTYFSLTNFGPMGGAIPLGIGAKLARPDKPLMVATGDGCMLMHGMELHTAAREEIPLVIAVMNNQAYGNIYYRASQMGDGPARLTDIPGIDWVAFSQSMGGDGERVDEPAQIKAAVNRALQANGPYLLDLRIDKTYPTPVGVWRQRQHEWEDND